MKQQRPTIAGSSFRGMIGVAREQITPPIGIYARCWGAARHDVAEGVHRPLTLTCVTFQSSESEPPLVLMSADLMSWRSREDEWFVRGGVLEALSLDASRLMLCLTHTHSAPSTCRDNALRPGGHLIEPYLCTLRDAAVRAAQRALEQRTLATLTWKYGTCDLATNRDLPDPADHPPRQSRIVCGYNPDQPADHTLLVGRISDDRSQIVGTIINYACHPTTLAWENKLLSPDYVGAMREVLESHTLGPCLFLQGASGELAPAEQYVGDVTIADRHGRRVGHAAVATLEAMQSPGTKLDFAGVVESGAPLAVWREAACDVSSFTAARMLPVDLVLKPLPTVAELEAQWRDTSDPVLKERLWRKRGVRRIVGDGSTSAIPLWAWRIGNALLVGQCNEAYSIMQMQLRRAFNEQAVAVMNLVNGSAGYLPPRELYDQDVYQVWQTPFERGSLERVTEAARCALLELTRGADHENDSYEQVELMSKGDGHE